MCNRSLWRTPVESILTRGLALRLVFMHFLSEPSCSTRNSGRDVSGQYAIYVKTVLPSLFERFIDML